MTDAARRVVITGASRGLGLASAVHLYRRGWHVVAAMRSPEAGLASIRAATGADPGDPRLTGVRLDLTDRASIDDAATRIVDDAGTPFGLVHNAGVVSAGCAEELPPEVFEEIFATNVFGAAHLTRALLPAMRASGRGRIVAVSSQAAVHGMPSAGAYSASKSALERWAEALAMEIAPFGLGVSVLVAGTFRTDIIDRAHTVDHGDPEGPYGYLQPGKDRVEGLMQRLARPPERFAPALERALTERRPFVRRGVGVDAVALRAGRALMPTWLLRRGVGTVMGIPRAPRVDPRRPERALH